MVPDDRTSRPDRDPGSGAPGAPPSTRWRTLRAVLKVAELRLRFIALMAGTGLVFGYWDTIANRFEKWGRPPRGRVKVADRIEYYCPMHPSVGAASPSRCPSCGMPLSRRQRGAAATLPEGVLARVRLSPRQVAQAGVRTVAVGFAPASERLTTAGIVRFDESQRALVASDARGRLRVERLHAFSEGAPVRTGQPLAELYGYDVAQAIRAFLEAKRVPRDPPQTPGGPDRTPLGDPEERVRLAVQDLKVLGVRQEQIDAIAAGDSSGELLPILAPIGGQVIRREVREGQYVPEGGVLFEVADTGRVWVDAGVFEVRLGRIEIGRSVEATVPAFPGEVFRGSVAQIAPAIDPATRTASVRFELDNPDHRLRPGMFATVTLDLAPAVGLARRQVTCPVTGRRLGSMGPAVRVELGGRTAWVCCEGCVPKLRSAPDRFLAALDASMTGGVLSVPESAVIDTGASRVVYVESEPGLFEGRAVILGPRSGDGFPVLDGLAPGERVATAGAFLIDAETRLNPSTRGAPPPAEIPATSPPTPSPRAALVRE